MSENDSDKATDNASTAQMSGDGQTTHVKIYSPYKVYFDNEAQSISAVNNTGPFDVLPNHHNFITLLQACVIDVQSSKGEQKIRISGGLMHVKANRVIVFLDI